MSFSFQRLKTIGLPTKHLINGYIRQCQDGLFGDTAAQNPYYNIPEIVNNYCMLFYEIFTWYKKNRGEELEFLSDTEVTLAEEHSLYRRWNTCMFENAISNKYCDRFSITFKIKSFGKYTPSMDPRDLPDFYIGYTTEKTLGSSIIDWQCQLGEYKNSQTSCAWDVYDDELFFSGKGECFAPAGYYSKYHVNDLFKLVIDFGANSVSLYHNDIEADSRKIDVKKLWVGFSLGYCQNRIEMVGYKYE